MNIIEQPIWEPGIYQLETTDLVLGGDPAQGGIANQQALQLANRTAYLNGLLGILPIANVQVSGFGLVAVSTAMMQNRLLLLDLVATNKTVFLDGATNLPDGGIIHIACSSATATIGNVVKITPHSNAVFFDRSGGTVAFSELYLYGGETITLIKNGASLVVLQTESNMYCVGELVYGFRSPVSRAAVAAQGQLLTRKDYPRLWQWLTINGVGSSVISEATYLTNQQMYSGSFTDGNGTTTFRIPDLRGAFIRGLDKGRGLDIDRVNPNIDGIFQWDEFRAHSHSIKEENAGASITTVASSKGMSTPSGQNKYTSNTGGSETRPYNIAYTAYIKY